MKRFLISALVLSLVLSCPSFAEEETEDEFVKGSRMNPYELGEDIEITCYDKDESGESVWADVTINIEGVVSTEDLEERYPDDSISDGSNFVLEGTLKTEEASSDDEEIYFDVYPTLLSADLKDDYWTYLKYASDLSTFYGSFSYIENDIIIECLTDDPSDGEGGYLRISYYAAPDDIDYEEDIYNDSYIWIKLP